VKVDRVLTRTKRPAEKFPLSWDFTEDVLPPDAYSAHAITATDVASGVDVSATILENAAHSDALGTVLTVRIKAGTDAHDYDILYQVTTTDGNIYQHVLRVSVRA
jgi:hypothetical protein